jgi:shikimate dehydrogenase
MQTFAVFGHPIAHSFSPIMHHASFAAIGYDGHCEKCDVPPEDLEAALLAHAKKGTLGVNLTIPHKMLALPMMDTLTPEAQRLGAVNTVCFREGKRHGHNTDGPGFIAAVKKMLAFDPSGHPVAVIGCGGAGRAIALTLASEGASWLGLIDIDTARAQALANEITATTPCHAEVITHARLKDADLIAQCSPSGLAAFPEPAARAEDFRPGQKLYDIVIPPGEPETPTMKEALRAGVACANGIAMLVEQGALAFTFWTGLEPDREAMMRAVEAGVRHHA